MPLFDFCKGKLVDLCNELLRSITRQRSKDGGSINERVR